MTKIIIDTEESAVKYIEKVLSEWTSFCKTHTPLAQSLEVLLETHKSKNKAYRKASEVAFAELKKKYTESEKENG